MSVNTEEEFRSHLAKGRWVVAGSLQYLGGMQVSDLGKLLFRSRWVPTLCYLPRVLYLLFQSTRTSCLAWAEQWKYGSRIRAAELPEDPLFIVGHFRSGTTLLHHLLALDPGNAAPTLHSCYNPHTFLLQEGALDERRSRFAPAGVGADGLVSTGDGAGISPGAEQPRNWWEEQRRDASSSTWTRPMDAVKESMYTPWEDEYALALLTGGLSNYCGQGSFGGKASARIDRYAFCSRSSGYPSSMPPAVEPEEWMTEEEEERWREAMALFVKKQVVRYGSQRRLVLKSPMHTAKIGVLRDMFPRAKFIFIHRHPLSVLKSSERTYMQLLPFRQLEQPSDLEAVHEWLIRLYDRLHWPYLHCWRSQLLEEGTLAEMSFKEFTADKVSAIQKLYSELGYQWTPEYESCLSEYLAGEVEDMVPGTRQARRGDESGLFTKAAKSETLRVMAETYHYDVVLDPSE